MLSLGTWLSPGGERLLRFAWTNGVRYVDTAKSYGSEPMIARWMNGMPAVRKDLFLVTKDQPNTPEQLIPQLDQRLAALQTDHVDLILLHALGDRNFELELRWLTSPQLKQTADAIRKSKKAKFVGFSTHHPHRALLLQAAATGGFLDAIMLQNNPWIAQDDDMNRALDACYKRGIGLISMKQVAGNVNLDEIGRLLPELDPAGAHALPGPAARDLVGRAIRRGLRVDEEHGPDPRERRGGTPVPAGRPGQDRPPPRRLHRRGADMCASCDGRCSKAAGTTAELGNLTRFLTYHEHHGYRSEARRLYAELDEPARDWHGADLEAARQACPNRLDFARLLPKAEELLG